MTARVQSQCTPSCSRFLSPFNPANTTGVKACAAFPQGIPDRVWNNELDHREPIDGDHGLRWEANEGYDFPTYAFAPEALGKGTMVAAGDFESYVARSGRETLTGRGADQKTEPGSAGGYEASTPHHGSGQDGDRRLVTVGCEQRTLLATVTGELHTGAMIALILADPEQLAVDGGEPPEELHCTLLFLGEADKIDDQRRTQILEICEIIAAGWSEFEAEAFSVAMFNPLGDEPCIVLGLSGVELADLHDDIEAEIETDVDQHQPWVPHITLAYTDDAMLIGDLLDRCGPVVFDRLRVAFGDQITDIPLGDEEPDEPDDEDEPAEDVPVVASRVQWDGCPRCSNPVHDGPCTAMAA